LIFISILLGIIFGYLFVNQIGSMIIADEIAFSFLLLVLFVVFVVFCVVNILLNLFNQNSKKIGFVCGELNNYFGNELEIQNIIKSGKKKKLFSSIISGIIIPLFTLGISFVITYLLEKVSIFLSIGFICLGLGFILISVYLFNNYNSFAVSVREYLLFNVNYYNYIMGSDSYWLKSLISINNQTQPQSNNQVQETINSNSKNKSCQQDTQSVKLSEDLESDLLDGLFGDDFDDITPTNSNNDEIDDIFK